MIKKMAVLIAFGGLLAGTLTANAQLFPFTGTSTTPSSSVIAPSSTVSSTASATIMSSTTSSIATTTPAAPVPSSTTSTVSSVTQPTGMLGQYIQFDGLTVVSVPSNSATEPVQILAANPTYSTMTANGTVMPATAMMVSCEQFATNNAATGNPVTCPAPPIAPLTQTSTASSSATSYAPYTIDVNNASQLLLSNRSAATLANVTPGDTINVYGFYDTDGNIEAEIVRDMSKSNGGAAVSGTGTTSVTGTTGATSTAALQAELNQLEALVMQLESELNISISATSTPTSSSFCPMIPAGSTSTAGCPPAGAATGSIYY